MHVKCDHQGGILFGRPSRDSCMRNVIRWNNGTECAKCELNPLAQLFPIFPLPPASIWSEIQIPRKTGCRVPFPTKPQCAILKYIQIYVTCWLLALYLQDLATNPSSPRSASSISVEISWAGLWSFNPSFFFASRLLNRTLSVVCTHNSSAVRRWLLPFVFNSIQRTASHHDRPEADGTSGCAALPAGVAASASGDELLREVLGPPGGVALDEERRLLQFLLHNLRRPRPLLKMPRRPRRPRNYPGMRRQQPWPVAKVSFISRWPTRADLWAGLCRSGSLRRTALWRWKTCATCWTCHWCRRTSSTARRLFSSTSGACRGRGRSLAQKPSARNAVGVSRTRALSSARSDARCAQ